VELRANKTQAMKSMICNHLIRPAKKWLRVVPPGAASGKESRQADVEFHIRHYFTKSLLIKFKLMAMVGISKTGKLTRSTSYASAVPLKVQNVAPAVPMNVQNVSPDSTL
jgi:hypothetical protein